MLLLKLTIIRREVVPKLAHRLEFDSEAAIQELSDNIREKFLLSIDQEFELSLGNKVVFSSNRPELSKVGELGVVSGDRLFLGIVDQGGNLNEKMEVRRNSID